MTETLDVPADADWEDWVDDRGWGDGLPTVAPTEDRVDAMLQGLPDGAAAGLAALPPSGLTPTLRSVAANAVMAGCVPGMLPVLLAALEAVSTPAYNLHGTLATTHPCAPMVLVSGSARAGFHGGGNCFGPGNRRNATLGRALSLVLLHVGGARPGTLDRSTQGSPAKYTFSFAESDESPWAGLPSRRGFDDGEPVVSVMAAEPPHNVNDHGSTTGDGILTTIAGTMAETGSNNVYVRGPHLLVLGPEHAATLHRDGWDPVSIREHLWKTARIPVEKVSPGNREQFVEWGVKPDGDAYTVSTGPEQLHVAVAGGAGKHSAWIPSFGGTELVSVRVRR
ncbi:hypothetical protein [Actinomycetospora termitidis]|uniref:Uncharacterized protein n=1 Tax=Actinomycetospora termitidis TaxID=3053470 RepID=A0ABT7MEJ1_9PSEU|nr:hypothetical protein [Actinomycetospora sp. Odt1-22]MDL5159083.1 hypothetical protein [Actinomycetospora sp. Odt1-22]